MEVHHHPKIEKKSFKEYFLEFIMIFLAVTLGFFAESYREHIVNSSKEKDYMRSMMDDLRNDSAKLDALVFFFHNVQANYDSVSRLLKSPITTPNLLKAYRLTAGMDDMLNFDYSNRTVSQLKSSGDFRLIKSKPVSDGIIDYDAFIVNNYNIIQKAYGDYYAALMEVRHQVFDVEIFNKMGRWDVGKLGPVNVSFFKHSSSWDEDSLITKMILASDKSPRMLNNQPVVSAFRNELQGAIRLIDYAPMFGFLTIKEKNAALMMLIQQKYHLK